MEIKELTTEIGCQGCFDKDPFEPGKILVRLRQVLLESGKVVPTVQLSQKPTEMHQHQSVVVVQSTSVSVHFENAVQVINRLQIVIHKATRPRISRNHKPRIIQKGGNSGYLQARQGVLIPGRTCLGSLSSHHTSARAITYKLELRLEIL